MRCVRSLVYYVYIWCCGGYVFMVVWMILVIGLLKLICFWMLIWFVGRICCLEVVVKGVFLNDDIVIVEDVLCFGWRMGYYMFDLIDEFCFFFKFEDMVCLVSLVEVVD